MWINSPKQTGSAGKYLQMLFLKFAKRFAMILVVTLAPLMMPRAANAGADEFEAWQHGLHPLPE